MNLVLAIIHYNENQYLDKLFSTISKSSLLPNKIVFIDNNSDINPINIIKKYDNLNIEYIRSDKNLLFTRGMNIAIRLAMKSNADVIGIMNSDMYVQNNTFEEIIKHINGPNIVAVTPNIRNIINTKDIFCPIKYTGIFKKSSYPQSNDLICETDFAIGASLFVKKDILEKTGLFYEPYLHGTDDFEMCDKLRKYGKILYIKTTNIYHRDSNERKDAPSKKNEFFEKLHNKNWYIYCLRNKPTAIIYIVLSMFSNLYKWVINKNIIAKWRLFGTINGIKETVYHLTNTNKYLD